MARRQRLNPSRHRAPTFADPALQAALDADGYAVAPVLPPQVARDVEQACIAFDPPDSGPMTFANVEADRRFLRQVQDLVEPLWAVHLLPLVPGHRVAFTTCVIKRPGPWSQMDAHEDGTFVDEAHHRAVTVWLSLSDCLPADRNGMIQVLPGSQDVAGVPAGAGVHEWHRRYRRYLTEHLTPVPTTAGQAVFWDTRLLHGSPANTSDRARFALAAVLVPEGAAMIHVEALGRQARRVFAVDDHFHQAYSPVAVRHRMPEGYRELGRHDDPVVDLDPERVRALCDGHELPAPERHRPTQDWVARSGAIDGGPPQLLSVDDGSAYEPLVARAVAADRAGIRGAELPHAFRPAWASGPWCWSDPPADVAALAAAAGLDETSARVLVLGPDAGVGFAAEEGDDDEVYLPLVTVGSPAGIASPTAELPFELGFPIAVSTGTDRQAWNGGGEEVRCLVARRRAG